MIKELIGALKAGQELKNASTWKNMQATTSAIVAIAGAVFMALGWVGVHIEITTDQVMAIAGGIAGILGVFDTYSTLATSKRVGLPSGSESDGNILAQQHVDP